MPFGKSNEKPTELSQVQLIYKSMKAGWLDTPDNFNLGLEDMAAKLQHAHIAMAQLASAKNPETEEQIKTTIRDAGTRGLFDGARRRAHWLESGNYHDLGSLQAAVHLVADGLDATGKQVKELEPNLTGEQTLKALKTGMKKGLPGIEPQALDELAKTLAGAGVAPQAQSEEQRIEKFFRNAATSQLANSRNDSPIRK